MIAHEAARERQLLPLAEADLHTTRPSGTELRFESGPQLFDHIIGPGSANGSAHGRLVVEPWNVTHTYRMLRPKFEAEEILERAGQTGPPFAGGDSRQIDAIHQNPAVVGLVHTA